MVDERLQTVEERPRGRCWLQMVHEKETLAAILQMMAHIPDDFETQYVNKWSTLDQMEEMEMGLGSNPTSFPIGTDIPNNPLVGGSSGQQQNSESEVIPHGKRAKTVEVVFD
ncbi:hypothetical protein Dsin_019320 [Dipteronia sinensis]|uniref:Uncharacterized protein n=1 Tax=Dipteronia sinensis TaxID=43782 RepID=A0AAE0E3Y0_9ROSI|nr:hypothetical protein Dsin_019320 [Dipteronia sinensis]